MSTQASIVIPTRNRKDILRQSIQSAFAQTVPVEVIVLDDGSTDGTAEMVTREFPAVRFSRFEGPNGPSFLRNRGSELAVSPILFPIDDDSVFASPRTVEQTLAEFDHPRVGAVGIPFINVRQNQAVQQRAPDGDAIYVEQAYVGAAHALRRDLFLKLGGYREWFFYMGEEGDYCIRMLNAGYVTRLGRADSIHHHESPSRVLERADLFGRRNDVLYVWHNVPMPWLVPHILATSINGIRFGIRVGRARRMIKGITQGWLGCVQHRNARAPVNANVYRISRRLKKNGPLPLAMVEPYLPALA